MDGGNVLFLGRTVISDGIEVCSNCLRNSITKSQFIFRFLETSEDFWTLLWVLEISLCI
jgi:hypothetical protein